MKTKKITALLLILSMSIFAQKNIPTVVKATFAKNFPSIKVAKWEKENENFEAGFTKDGMACSALISAKGKLLESETEIDLTTLPAPCIEYVAKNYPSKKLQSAAKIIDFNGNVTYEAAIKGLDLIFDTKGTFIKSAKD